MAIRDNRTAVYPLSLKFQVSTTKINNKFSENWLHEKKIVDDVYSNFFHFGAVEFVVDDVIEESGMPLNH